MKPKLKAWIEYVLILYVFAVVSPCYLFLRWAFHLSWFWFADAVLLFVCFITWLVVMAEPRLYNTLGTTFERVK